VGNLASGSVSLTNVGTPPGALAPSISSKSVDKRLDPPPRQSAPGWRGGIRPPNIHSRNMLLIS
jgi:hypothetical protein